MDYYGLNIIHVHLKEPYQGQEDWYFGSLSAIYSALPKEVVGIGEYMLHSTFAKSRKCPDTGKAVIKKGKLIRKEKKKNDTN